MKHTLSTYADVIAKTERYEILHTVHFVEAFKRSMENNIDGL